jgi:hypothetical protein
MSDDPLQPAPEKPRFLLPDGCSDLIDALQFHRQIDEAVSSQSAPPPSSGLPQSLAKSVALPDPVSIRDLASALNLQPFQVIGSLMQLNVFCALDADLDFNTASVVCKLYDVAATKIA